MNITLKVFGIFREYINDEIQIDIKDGSKLFNLKEYMYNNILINNLTFLRPILKKSIFSNKEEILSFNYILKYNDEIYLLPPFSGG